MILHPIILDSSPSHLEETNSCHVIDWYQCRPSLIIDDNLNDWASLTLSWFVHGLCHVGWFFSVRMRRIEILTDEKPCVCCSISHQSVLVTFLYAG